MTTKNVTLDEWIAALRSGEYKQYTYSLRDSAEHPTAYCCIGVLGALAGENRWTNPGYGHAARLVGDHEARHLQNMNDVHGNTFDEIADYLEGLK